MKVWRAGRRRGRGGEGGGGGEGYQIGRNNSVHIYVEQSSGQNLSECSKLSRGLLLVIAAPFIITLRAISQETEEKDYDEIHFAISQF